MKKIILLLLLLIPMILNSKESSTLMELIIQARANTPLSEKNQSFEKMSRNEINEISSNWYPQISIDAQTTYQSNAFELPFQIPNTTLPEVPLFQYRTTLNINQMIYDGGKLSVAKELSANKFNLNLKINEVNLSEIDRKVSDIYFGIVITKEKIKILANYKIKLIEEEKRIAALVENGVVTISNLRMIQIEIAKISNEIYSANQDLKSLTKTMEDLVGMKINPEIINSENSISSNSNNERAEITMMEAKKKLNELQIKNSKSETMPKIIAFAQVGGGNPDPLNMFDDELSPYYLVGLKLQWKIFDWGNISRTNEKVEFENKIVEQDIEEFKRNIDIQNNIIDIEIEKFTQLALYYDKIIRMQEEINNEESVKIENGVGVISEYLQELAKLNEYKFNKELNKILAKKEEAKKVLVNGKYNINKEN